MSDAVPDVAYLVSQYPSPSHVFIEREILGLRARGARVVTYSVRTCPPELLMSATMRREAEATDVLQASRGALALAVARAAVREPGALARGVVRALRTGEPSPRARLWQVFYLVEAIVLRRLMLRDGLRHVHVHFANNGADIARALVALGDDIDGADAGWRWSFSMHGPTEFENVEKFDLRAKVQSASGIACITDFTRSQLMRSSDPAHWSKLSLVPMSVDVELFVPPSGGRDHDGALRVLFVGRLVPEKGPSILVEAIALLTDDGAAVEVRIAGGGPLAGELTREVEARGLGEVVHFLGVVGQDEILDLYHWADVFCLPSFQEGLPVVLMEAMATGLSVVTTPIAGIPELVQHRRTGMIVAPGRPDLLAAAIVDLRDDADLRARLGAEGRESVVDRHSLPHAAAAQARFLMR